MSSLLVVLLGLGGVSETWSELNDQRLAGGEVKVLDDGSPESHWMIAAVGIVRDAPRAEVDGAIRALSSKPGWEAAQAQLRHAQRIWSWAYALLRWGMTGFALALAALLVYGSPRLLRLHRASAWLAVWAAVVTIGVWCLRPHWTGTVALLLCGWVTLFHCGLSVLGGTLTARFPSDRKIRAIIMATAAAGALGLGIAGAISVWMARSPLLLAPQGQPW